MSERTLLAVGTRGRVTLGKLATARHYLAHTSPDGTVVLEPAVVMTAAEARLLAADRILPIVESNLGDPGRLVTRDRSRSARG